MVWHFLSLLFLILIANGSPILARYLMRTTLSCPIDFGYRFADQQRLFGEAKTWRGFFSSLIATGVSALLMGYDLATGLLIAMGAMSGDLISSFLRGGWVFVQAPGLRYWIKYLNLCCRHCWWCICFNYQRRIFWCWYAYFLYWMSDFPGYFIGLGCVENLIDR